jgi:hypothetical protein
MMSERIKELADQAATYAEEIAGDFHDNPKYDTAFEQKFAELIIKECSAVADRNQSENMNWPIGDIIKEHFGVE